MPHSCITHDAMKSYLVPHNISQQKMSYSKTNSHSIRKICMQPCAAPIRSSQPPRCGPLHQSDTAVCPHHCSAGPGLHKLLGLFSKRAQILLLFSTQNFYSIAPITWSHLVQRVWGGNDVEAAATRIGAECWENAILHRAREAGVERKELDVGGGKRDLREYNLTGTAGSTTSTSTCVTRRMGTGERCHPRHVSCMCVKKSPTRQVSFEKNPWWPGPLWKRALFLPFVTRFIHVCDMPLIESYVKGRERR